MLKIIPTSERPLSDSEIKQVHTIMRVAYEKTEVEIWGENYIRLFIEDYTILLNEGHIYVAYLNDVIVGSVHVYRKDESSYTFSLLSTDFNYGGQGIGTALVQKAEQIARENGATEMKMEILRVKHCEVPHKIRLHDYYLRLGYSRTHAADCNCIIPDWKYKLLKSPSDFDFYKKRL